MFKWIGYLLVAALIIAIITAPSEENFKQFALEKTDTTNCAPYIDYKSYKVIVTVFGIGHLKECKKTSIYNPQTGGTVGKAGIPSYGEDQAYLALFGKFWKL